MADDKIDRVIIEFFAALKELGELRRRYDNAVENGYLHMAKARYSMGASSVGKLQYDTIMSPSSLVDTVDNTHECSDDSGGPVFFVINTASDNDMSCDSGVTQLRRRVVDEKKVETVGPLQQEISKPHIPVKDPLKWFGLLVPPSLRTAQKNFIEAVDLSCQLSSAQAKVEHYRKLYLVLAKDKK
ncbi:coiled-coil domain-containing protein 115-like [Dysidea avara]|uniref:coiled-coil domain-containing protein 115-like n=1 Tax=Dysidea avara TaxID=196820 RepID=UPI003316C8F8